MKLERSAVVYVIENKQMGIRKIGITQDIDARISNLQTAAGCKLELLYYTKPIVRSVCEDFEKNLHEIFKHERTYGEWFRTDFVKIKAKIDALEPGMKTPFDYHLLDEGKSVACIANTLKVSRAAIFNRIKALKVPYDDLRNKMAEARKDPVVSYALIDENAEENWFGSKEVDTTGKFDRVSPNIYSNGHCYKASKFSNGRMHQEFFLTVSEAQKYLDAF